MNETLLNQNPQMATSNPQTNINRINNQQGIQPIQNNVNTPNNANQSNTINPITIPIQIQPQIAQNGQTQTNIQPNSNLQTISNQQPTPNYNAPTPQNYQNTNSNSNVVDFNQVYNAYNQSTGNINNNVSSGVKKTTYNTTIVTPTTNNLNTVQGQYQSAYADTVNGLIGEMLKQMQNGFSYDPTQDASLKLATEYASNSTLQSLAGSGVLNSSATAERVARIVSELIPQYEEKAHNRWIEYLGQLADTAQLVMNYDAQQFEYWKDSQDRAFQEKQFEYQKQQDALENAWKRVDELGYVDNESSKVLGVKVGTLSGAAREAKEQREFELQKMREQLEIQRANEEALTRLKSELDYERNRALAEYQSQLNRQEAELKSQLNREEAEHQSNLNKNEAQFQSQLNKQELDYKSQLNRQEAEQQSQLNKQELDYRSQLNRQEAEQQSQLNKQELDYKSQLNKSETENQYKLEQQYNSSNSNTISLNTYRDVINSRFAVYDDITNTYTIKDNASLYNYLVSEYASGRLSENDLSILATLYNVTEPTEKDNAKAERLKYLESLGK